MAQPWADKFYKSKPWRRCRNAYVKFKGGICEHCGEVGNEVHHKIELTEENVSDPMISLCFDNLQLLCHRCHDATKHNGVPVRGDIAFDADGNVIHRTGTPPVKNTHIPF